MKKLHVIAFLVLIFSILACKKEEVNNQDIDDFVINTNVEAIYPTLTSFVDVNIDGEIIQDFQFVITHPDGDPDQHSMDIRVYDDKYQILTHAIDDADVVIKLDKNTEIKPANTVWKGSLIFMYHYIISVTGTVYHYGYSDIGDQYIAFRKKNSSGGYFYGWMKINISNNGEKLELKEYALHKIADTPIKAGEK